MPIRPENKGLYPANWKEVVAGIRERSEDRCELCGVINGQHIQRNAEGSLWRYQEAPGICFHIGTYAKHYVAPVAETWRKPIRIVLTVAHLDHDPRNNDPENLRHWCQYHHNLYDAAHRAENRKRNRA